MADESTVKINIVTAGDAAGAKAVEDQVKKVAEATEQVTAAQEKNVETVVGSSKAEAKQVDAFEAAAAAIEAKLAALEEGTEAQQKHSEAVQEGTRQTSAMDDAVRALPGGLRGLVAGLGGAATAAYVLRAGFDAWLERNPEIEQSFENLKGQLGEVAGIALSDWFETWIMKSETAVGVIDSLIIALGGQTQAMKDAAAPLPGYASDTELAEERARAFAESLEEQARAASRAAEELRGQLEIIREMNALNDAKADRANAAKKREIDASDMTPEEKIRAKAAIDTASEQEKLKGREQGRLAEVDAANKETAASQSAAAALAQQQQQAERRLAEIQRRAGAEAQIPELEANVKRLEEALKSVAGEISPEGEANARAEIDAAKAALDARRAERDAIAPGDADAQRDDLNAIKEQRRAAEEAARAAAAKAEQTRRRVEIQNRTDEEKTAQRVDEITARAEAQARAAEETARKKKEAEDKRAAKARDEELARAAENDAIRYERAGDPKKAAEARNRAAEFREGLGRQDREPLTEQQKKRLELDAEERRSKAVGNVPGGAAASKGAAAAAALQASGMGDAADKVSRATESLKDGATAAEAAKAAAALAALAPAIGQMNAETRKAMSDLWQAVKLIQQQLKNGRN